MVDVFGIKIHANADFEQLKDRLFCFIPSENIKQVLRFKNNNDRIRSLFGEVLSRKCLGQKLNLPSKDIEIKKTVKGKPYLLNNPSSLFFNISHSGNWVLLALSGADLGIDVEKIKKPAFRVAERYFTQEELTALNSLKETEKAAYFYDLWTLKESYLKLLGKGLTKSLGSFSITGQKGDFSLAYDKFGYREVFFYQYNIDPAYKFSICSESKEFAEKVQLISIDELIAMNHGA